ncbi:MAG: hypothetical protein ACRDRP_21815 [Pseudonocardiaceae bacterium]
MPLELAYAIELNGEFLVASVALFPEHGEPTERAGALGGVEAVSVVVIDAEVGFQLVQGVVGDGAGADVLDLIGGVEGDVAAAGEFEVDAAQGVTVVQPVEQVGVPSGEDGRGGSGCARRRCRASGAAG